MFVSTLTRRGTHIRERMSKRAAPSLRSEMVVTGRARSKVVKKAKKASSSLVSWSDMASRWVQRRRVRYRESPSQCMRVCYSCATRPTCILCKSDKVEGQYSDKIRTQTSLNTCITSRNTTQNRTRPPRIRKRPFLPSLDLHQRASFSTGGKLSRRKSL